MTWIHVFEEDSAGQEVYRREDGPIPLSRRPRERIQVRPDGTASVFLPGPGDGYVECQAKWNEEGGGMVIRVRDARLEFVVIERTASRLLIERRQAADNG